MSVIDLFNKWVMYMTDPGTAVPALTGMCLGIFVGSALSKYAWIYFCIGRREKLAAEQREREEEAKEKQEKLDREFYRQRAVLDIHENSDGVLVDESNRGYCPDCYERKVLSPLVRNHAGTRLFCPTCHYTFEPEN